MMQVGNSSVVDIQFGDHAVEEIRLGSTTIWSASDRLAALSDESGESDNG